jgi:hypothetical protein
LKQWGFAVLSFEIRRGPQYDLSRKCVIDFINSLFVSHKIAGVFLGTPCTTWSIAAGPAGRSREHIWGLPDLSPARALRVREGNQQARLTARWISMCINSSFPVMLENPHTSLLWHAPPIAALLRKPSCRSATFTMCAYGARWRKAMKICGWYVDVSGIHGNTCVSKNHICQFTGAPHIRLSGHLPRSSKAWTSLAAAYPHRLASALACVLACSSCPPQLLSRLRGKAVKPCAAEAVAAG